VRGKNGKKVFGEDTEYIAYLCDSESIGPRNCPRQLAAFNTFQAAAPHCTVIDAPAFDKNNTERSRSRKYHFPIEVVTNDSPIAGSFFQNDSRT
jgi:hypothetical protein